MISPMYRFVKRRHSGTENSDQGVMFQSKTGGFLKVGVLMPELVTDVCPSRPTRINRHLWRGVTVGGSGQVSEYHHLKVKLALSMESSVTPNVTVLFN